MKQGRRNGSKVPRSTLGDSIPLVLIICDSNRTTFCLQTLGFYSLYASPSCFASPSCCASPTSPSFVVVVGRRPNFVGRNSSRACLPPGNLATFRNTRSAGGFLPSGERIWLLVNRRRDEWAAIWKTIANGWWEEGK